jgi:hypothetical protein
MDGGGGRTRGARGIESADILNKEQSSVTPAFVGRRHVVCREPRHGSNRVLPDYLFERNSRTGPSRPDGRSGESPVKCFHVENA